MFKKTNKQNIRKRRDTEEDISEDEKVVEKNAVLKPMPVKSHSSNKKEKKKESKQASLLSFDDGEEDDLMVVKLKKSSRSRRIAKEIKKRSQQEKEALNNSVGTNGSANQRNEKNIHIFKPLKQKQDENKLPNASSKKDNVSVIPNFDSGVIPTPSMIHAARKQREMLRKFGSEYISAEDTQKYKETTQSRLVRDDDDEDSSDDGIMELKGIEKKNENSSTKFVPNESDEEDDKINEEENADEEVDRWEEEMIKKGINAQTNQSMPSIPPPIPPPNFFNNFGDYYHNVDQQFPQYSRRQVEAKSDVTFDSIKKRLQDHLNGLKLQNQSNVVEMNKLDQDTTECNDMSKHLGDVKSISDEYQFYQEMHQYVKDLLGCLRENVKLINSLEENAHLLWKNQAERLISRRRQDIQDESNQIAFINKGTHDNNPNSDHQFVARAREREARRTRRRAARQIKQSASHFDGLSTDDEETTMDQAQFDTEIQRIQASCSSLFDDVVDDFCILQNILQRFDSWRKQHNDSYNDAYIALCIPKIIFPFIRHRMILWNPLLSFTSHFEEEDWYKDLCMFGLKLFPLNGQEDNGNILDDAKILSSVIEKVLCVKLLYFIQHVWDPMSTQQTVRLCLILKDLNRNYPFMTADHHQCQKLFQAVCKRLQSSVDNDIFIPLLPASSTDSPVHAFLERQTWASIKLFKNAMLLDGILSYKVLCEIAIESILNRYILLALQISVISVSCLYKCQKIVDSIPKNWIREHEDLRKQLSSLARFLVHFAQSIKASEQIASKTMLKQIKTMLLVIGARDALLQI